MYAMGTLNSKISLLPVFPSLLIREGLEIEIEIQEAKDNSPRTTLLFKEKGSEILSLVLDHLKPEIALQNELYESLFFLIDILFFQ